MIFKKCLDGYYDVENQLPSYMNKMATEYFEKEDRKSNLFKLKRNSKSGGST